MSLIMSAAGFYRGNNLLERKSGLLGCYARLEVQLVCLSVRIILMLVVCGKCKLLNEMLVVRYCHYRSVLVG